MSKKSSLKNFKLLNKLGQGSFGTVYKVRRQGKSQSVDGGVFVMKIINTSGMDKRSQQDAHNEVKILASLDNPYIVKYY